MYEFDYVVPVDRLVYFTTLFGTGELSFAFSLFYFKYAIFFTLNNNDECNSLLGYIIFTVF